MRRRKFFHLLSGLAAGTAGWSSSRGRGPAVPPSPPETAAASGFNKYTQDYAQFCATPANERIFYASVDGRIVSEHLNDQSWRPTGWHGENNPPEPDPPALSVPGGSYHGVPMISPIPDLAGEGPYKPTWDSLQQYECPEWFRDAKFGIWNHWSPECVPEEIG